MNCIVRWLAALVLALAVYPLAAETNWPEKPVRLVVGFTAGSATDVTGRMFAQKFAEAWGQPVVVENVSGNRRHRHRQGRQGSPRRLHADVVRQCGHHHSAQPADTAVRSAEGSRADFDLAVDASIFLVNNELPVKSIAELIAYAKANPGKLSYGTPGVGTPQHVAGELFCHLAGIKMEHIPYRGANLADVMGGVVPVGIQNAGASLPLVRDGRVRGIAITSLKRSSNAPDLPTMVEAGFPGFEATSWFALLAPAGTPQPILDKVRAELLKVLADPEMQKKFAESRPRHGGQHGRGDARCHRCRHPEMGQGYQGRQHQAGQLRHGRVHSSGAGARRQRGSAAAGEARQPLAHGAERRRGDVRAGRRARRRWTRPRPLALLSVSLRRLKPGLSLPNPYPPSASRAWSPCSAWVTSGSKAT